MYDARQIANWFVERAARDGRRFTIMQLLKLVYISHGWHLEMHASPLINNKIEAWKFGPVIPDVYNTFRRQGVEINAPVQVENRPIPPLSDITHEEGSPWKQATVLWGYFAPIPNELILPHYQAKRQKAAAH
jgi:uncharacterized phage-associated protein